MIKNIEVKSDFDLKALDFLEKKLQMLKKIPKVDDTCSLILQNVKPTICHADYHRGNILHDEDMNVLSILDWDNAGISNPYIDFLQSYITLVLRWNFSYSETSKINGLAFLEAYQRGRGREIDIEQLQASWLVFINERVGTSWPVNKHYSDGVTKNDNSLGPVLDKSIYIANNHHEIFNKIVALIS